MNTKTLISGILCMVLLCLFGVPAPASEIHIAAEKGDVAKLQEILKKRPDLVNSRAYLQKMTPLHSAIRAGKPEAVKFLIENGSNLDLKEDDGSTPLHLAAFEGRKDFCEWLIAGKADVNSRDIDRLTPLHMAARQGWLDLVELLVSKGADVNSEDEQGRTPGKMAAGEGYEEIVAFLISHGARNLNARMAVAGKIFRAAVFDTDDRKQIEEILTKDSRLLNEQDDEGFTPLHLAALNANKEMLELFLAKGANVNAVAANGRTPLHMAVSLPRKDDEEFLKLSGKSYSSRIELIKILLVSGAALNPRDVLGLTPLGEALKNGHKEPAELLIKYGGKK
jgi:ankyrin repeat protein